MNPKCVWVAALAFAALRFTASGQTVDTSSKAGTGTSNATKEKAGDPALVYVEQMPEFPGGEQAMWEYVRQHTTYPDSARERGVQGRVYVRFVVDKDGAVQFPEVTRGVDALLDAEALRVVKSMPRWTPGKQGGRNVDVLYTLPISFKLD